MEIAKIFGSFIGVTALFALVIAVSYGVWYLLLSIIFWAFGPTIFGYVFSHKMVIGCWVVTIVLTNIFKRKG